MYISESKIPLYFVDNKTTETFGTNKDRNNIFKALIRNYNQEYINDPIDLELIIYIYIKAWNISYKNKTKKSKKI